MLKLFMLRKKLLINLAIILICGAIALSLPVIVSHLQKPTSASTEENEESTTNSTTADWQLTSTFVGQKYQDKIDCGVVWQIEQKHGNKVITTWDEIYANITATRTSAFPGKRSTPAKMMAAARHISRRDRREGPCSRSARSARSGCSKREAAFALARTIPTCCTEKPYDVRKRSANV